MKSAIKIEIEWLDEIPEENLEAVELDCLEKIVQLLQEGYTSGTVSVDSEYETPIGRTKEITYTGSWSGSFKVNLTSDTDAK